ncbi:MAG: general secretion pathway protein [Candidimonas sp.]|nr:MAG: general secretion pathway protein [Candidimonas sp.]TAM22973.1 MAG: general secretion pathway protein [Candidimonas sp.]TAM77575.1 MAG: general secretion pathway protein [Candidimonas sp.]
MFGSLRRLGLTAPACGLQTPIVRFAATQAVVVASSDDLSKLDPAIFRSLSVEFEVEALAGRLCPVQLTDQSVAIFALAEHVGGDQADELARRVGERGYALATPQRYVLAAPLLLAIARNQVRPQSRYASRSMASHPARTALASAFQDMVEWGVRHGASDLHVNIRFDDAESEVRYTLAGRYVAPERFRRMPTRTLFDMLSVAWMDIQGGNGAVFDPMTEQQGRLSKQVDGRAVVLRWASLAADQGPSVCLRLLERDAAAHGQGLAELGYMPEQIDAIERAMLSESGAIVFAGTVGSGKSTTLACLMTSLPDFRKIITIEDPVEFLIPHAIQNTVVRDLGATAHEAYATKLRTLKRSAMTDVLLGEIRDRESGLAFMDLAGSGVNVYTTTHAPSAALVGERLASDFIGVSRDFLATPGVLKLLVYQVLLPRLCAHCCVPALRLLDGGGAGVDGRYREAGVWRQWLGRLRRLYDCDIELLRIRNPEGCVACRGPQVRDLDGLAGRTVAAEYIEPALSPGFLDGLRRPKSGVRSGSSDTDKYEETPRATAMECAVHKALRGEIDPRDIEPRFQSFETCERQLRLTGKPGLRVVA